MISSGAKAPSCKDLVTLLPNRLHVHELIELTGVVSECHDVCAFGRVGFQEWHGHCIATEYGEEHGEECHALGCRDCGIL